MEIISHNLSWEPFVVIEDCDDDGLGCKSKGLLVDLMNVWANELNFTWQNRKDLDNNWGMFPDSGELIEHYLMGQGPNLKKIPQNSSKQIWMPEGM